MIALNGYPRLVVSRSKNRVFSKTKPIIERLKGAKYV